MISLYFGLPGAGKTTVLTWHIVRELRLIDSGKSRYSHIWTNADVTIVHPALSVIPFSDMVRYDLGVGSLLLVDEAQLEFGTRDYKNFTRDLLRLFSMHRHYKYDIECYTQRFDGLDLNVRTLTAHVFYIRKGLLPFSHVYPVQYGIYIPRKKDSDSKDYGDIKQGYFRWSIWASLFHTRLLRPVYYGLYDSFCRPDLKPHPDIL